MTLLPYESFDSLPYDLTGRIAPEIYDHILDNLSTSKKVLSKCSIVCRAWLRTCRYHLFATVTFRPDILEFMSSPVTGPIAPFIRTVILKGSWIENHTESKHAISLLVTLENLFELRLQSCDWDNVGFSTAWSTYDALFDRLTRLHLQSVHFPSPFALINLVGHMHMLQHLTLDKITWDRDGLHSPDFLDNHSQPWPCPPPIPAGLTTLNITSCMSGPILSWILSQTTRTLSLGTVVLSEIHAGEICLVGNFLHTVGPHLVQLELGFSVHNPNVSITQGEYLHGIPTNFLNIPISEQIYSLR